MNMPDLTTGDSFAKKGDSIDIVVSGYFGYGNSGDDTALDCLVSAIKQESPQAKIAVLCREPKKFGEAHGVIGIGRYDLPAIIGALRGARLLISGGGSLLQNVTSSRSLFYYAGVIALGKLCGTKVFICANGIGPLRGRIGRAVAYRAVMCADRVSVRDPSSRRRLVDIGVPEDKVALTADPAFMLSFKGGVSARVLMRKLGMTEKRKYFAVSLRASACKGRRMAEVCRACRDVYLNLGLVPVFVSMQESEDRELCRRIAEETCGDAVVIPPLPAEYLCPIIGGMETVLSMRLHLMIYAAAVGTPAIGVSVDPKLDAVAGILGSAKIIRDGCFDASTLVSAVRDSIESDRKKLLQIAEEQGRIAREDVSTAVAMINDSNIIREN